MKLLLKALIIIPLSLILAFLVTRIASEFFSKPLTPVEIEKCTLVGGPLPRYCNDLSGFSSADGVFYLSFIVSVFVLYFLTKKIKALN